MLRPRTAVRRVAALSAGVFAASVVAACAQQGTAGRTGASPSAAPNTAGAPVVYSPSITEADLRARVFIFADDSMQGRAAGTPGHDRALDYIVSELERLRITPKGEDGYFQRVPIERRSAGDATKRDTMWTRNVVAVIEGSDPTLAAEYVAVGAHSDHVGLSRRPVDHDSIRAFNRAAWEAIGRDANSRGPTAAQRAAIRVDVNQLRAVRPARLDSINNGADDDGSGSMALLEIAEALATSATTPRRSVLLVWHSAEELGLNGSEWFTDHPTVPREQIVAQINIDMIGRGSVRDVAGGGEDYLTVLGPKRLSSQMDQWVRDVNARQSRPFALDYQFDADGHPQQFYCRSDHYNYARHGIPIAFFFTSIHEDYHQVTDEPQYLEYPKYTRVTQYLHDLTSFVANQPARPVVDQPKPDPAGRCRQ